MNFSTILSRYEVRIILGGGGNWLILENRFKPWDFEYTFSILLMGEGKGGSAKCFKRGRGQSPPHQHTLIGETISRGVHVLGIWPKIEWGGLTENPKLLGYWIWELGWGSKVWNTTYFYTLQMKSFAKLVAIFQYNKIYSI